MAAGLVAGWGLKFAIEGVYQSPSLLHRRTIGGFSSRLLPEPEAVGLLALMLLQSRRTHDGGG